ncbi:MAG: serine/threonine-protein kinase, partial [Planctomycetota bacterium]
PDRTEFLARYPDLEEELGPCMTALEFLRQPTGAAPGPAAPERSRRIGDFEIEREIGRGGMGVVYVARQISLNRRVALKMLPFAAVLDPRQLQRFKNEAMAAAGLHHGNIVPVHSVGSERGIHYYAMQYVDGVSLADLIDELRDADGPAADSSDAARALTGGRSTRSGDYCRNVARLGADVAMALDHAHEQGVVHRDVKPANLLLEGSGRAWVTDFGLAAFRTERGLTMTGDLVGTVRYMSPEQTRAKRTPVDHRTDIYSLGVTLYELLTLAQAFPGEDTHAVLADVVEKDPPGVRRLNPAIPPELATIVLKAMAKRPEDRYETARELAEDLQRFLEDLPIRAKRPSLAKVAAKWSRRHRALVLAAATVFLVAFAGLAAGSALLAQEARRYESLYGRARDTLSLMLREVTRGREARMTGLSLELLEELRDFHAGFLRGEPAGDPREIAMAHASIGRILTILGDGAEAEQHLVAADGILEGLAAGASVRMDRIAVRLHFGELRMTRGDTDRARESYEAAVDKAEELVALFPSVESRLSRARARLGLARFLVSEERYREALSRCYRPAHDDLDSLIEADPENVPARQLFAEICHRASGAFEKLGETLMALGLRGTSGKAYRALADEFPEHPGADTWGFRKWEAEADCRALTWDLLRELPERHPTPGDVAGIDAALDGRGPLDPADRPLGASPARFEARAFTCLPWGDGPF